MNKIIFATANKGKTKEMQQELPLNFKIIDLQTAGITEEIPEPYFTFNENAHAKARYVYEKTGLNCFAEDSGLVVPALNNEPGVFSGRYAGDHATDEDNIKKLIQKITHVQNKEAYFISVICFIFEGKDYYFEGKCFGNITLNRKGNQGFGYDPIFIPKNHNLTFAELGLEEKNRISHRGFAFKKFLDFLKETPLHS